MTPPKNFEKRPRKKENPILDAVSSWLLKIPLDVFDDLRRSRDDTCSQLVRETPKRWVVYEPMVLLPSGSFATALWKEFLRQAIPSQEQTLLWADILWRITRRVPLTHLAVNEGIPLHVMTDALAHKASLEADGSHVDLKLEKGAGSGPSLDVVENVIRSPIGLRILYGDFGPDDVSSSVAGNISAGITKVDFNAAFWVSTKQNGIQQIWAPRWTMFSRGNVKEKARLLRFQNAKFHACNLGSGARTSTHALGSAIMDPRTGAAQYSVPDGDITSHQPWAVDLYAGIGYFVFSYVRLGFRVMCWELNPWSVEGLRRGAAANGWSCRVVSGADLSLPTAAVMEGMAGTGAPDIVVFHEDNNMAARRVEELRATRAMHETEDCGRSGRHRFPVVHVNCGLLPTSADTWEVAWSIVGPYNNGWLHLHENVGVSDIGRRREEIQAFFDGLANDSGIRRDARVEHVEQVKTFAPGVWHCVFDIYITSHS
ncbi:hypothetical protein VTK73DRAFT_111 [Phialemonium thermophilum]|uniref:tRNA wybutosine-synthesizing protein 2 n=1 Tax=Phialemonium thermophilum TaxID=223376 RepID=A0ABR3Y424_9PEZI